MQKLLKTLLHGLVLLTLPAVAAENRWIDSVTATVGDDKNSNQMDIYRIGLQNNWERTWFNGGAWYVGGYSVVGLAFLALGGHLFLGFHHGHLLCGFLASDLLSDAHVLVIVFDIGREIVRSLSQVPQTLMHLCLVLRKSVLIGNLPGSVQGSLGSLQLSVMFVK
mgnify:CR=1 FL=1